jgi:hypothetical protein
LEQKDLAFSGGIGPAIRCNLFIFKEKIKRISTAIGAKGRYFAFLPSFQKKKKLKIEFRFL